MVEEQQLTLDGHLFLITHNSLKRKTDLIHGIDLANPLIRDICGFIDQHIMKRLFC